MFVKSKDLGWGNVLAGKVLTPGSKCIGVLIPRTHIKDRQVWHLLGIPVLWKQRQDVSSTSSER